jgi:hypothetical protein
LDNNFTVASRLNVSGVTTLNSSTTCLSTLNIVGAANLTSDATVGSKLTVGGAITGMSTLNMTGPSCFMGGVGIGTRPTNFSSYQLVVNGNIAPYTIDKIANSGDLLLDSFFTTHYYYIDATVSANINTIMVPDSIYVVYFNAYGGSNANNDMYLSPNNTIYTNAFYTRYMNDAGTSEATDNYFYWDTNSGIDGYDPAGKITIYNTKSAKRILVETGDSRVSCVCNGYWGTQSSGQITYNTDTDWTTIGTMSNKQTSRNYNWRVWVRRLA